MAAVSKPVISFLFGGGTLTVASTLTSGGAVAVSYDKEGIEAKTVSLSNLSEFLKEGNTTKTLSDLVEGYSLTLTGARELTRVLTGSLLIDLIEKSSTTDSALNKALKEKLDLIRNNAKDKDQHKLFGGEEKYKNYHVLKGIRKVFIDELTNKTSTFLSGVSYDLKADSSSDTLIRSIMGDFYDSVLDDYIKYNKPLFVKRVVWKYSDEDVSAKSKELYQEAKDSVPGYFNPPSRASYLFPVAKKDSDEKWKKFVTQLKNFRQEDSLSEYSDDEDTHIVIPVSIVEDSSKTSQFIIAALELHGHAAYFNKWASKNKGTKKSNLSNEVTDGSSTLCSHNSATSNIPEIEFKTAESTYTSLEKLFCLEKSKTAVKEQQNPISDFIYLKHDKDENKAQNWILFKDRDHIQALGIGKDLKDSIDNVTEIKKELIKAAKNEENNKYKFNLQKELKSWLDKHLERLLLAKWKDIFKVLDSSEENGGDWICVVNKLKDLYESMIVESSLISLRDNVIRDYVDLISRYRPVTVNGNLKQINPNLAWAGRFPYQYNTQALSSEKKINGVSLVFDYLESMYLSKFEKIVNEQVSFETAFETKLKDKLKIYEEKLGLFFNNKKSSLTSATKKEDESVIYLFNYNSLSSTAPKNVQLVNVLNNLWVSMIHDDGAALYLTQSQIKDYLVDSANANILTWNKDDKEIKGFSNFISLKRAEIKKTLFEKDGTKEVDQEFYASLERNFYLSKIRSRFQSVSDPHVFGASILTQVNDFLDYENVKTVEKNIRQFHNSHGYDLLSEESRDYFVELVTMQYLSKNDFSNYRKVMAQKLDKNKFSAFVLHKKYEKDSICQPDTKDPDKLLDADKKYVWEYENRFLGFDHSKTKDWTNSNCLGLEDLSEVVVLKADDRFSTGKVTIKSGYKGLLVGDAVEKTLGKEIAEFVTADAPLWVDISTLLSNIKAIKTSQELDKLIQTLKRIYPSASWDWLEDKEIVETSGLTWNRTNWSASRGSISRKTLSLEQRKNIISGFVSQGNKDLVYKNANVEHKVKHQKEFMDSSVTDTDASFLKDFLKTRKTGFEKDKNGSAALKDSQGNKHIVYIEQIRYGDIVNETTFKSFLKGLSVDLIAQDIVKLASDKSIQQQAINYLLNEIDSSKGLNKFLTADTRLWSKIDINWRGKV